MSYYYTVPLDPAQRVGLAGHAPASGDLRMKPRLNVQWNEIYCKRCILCVEVCPEQVLFLEKDEIMEKPGCIRCYQCESYCPDIAIEVMDQEEKHTG